MNKSASTCSSGQSLTEFALALPVLLLVLIGAVDLGRVYYAYETITNASREGARLGIARPAQTADQVASIKNRVIAEASGSRITLTASNITVDCAPYGSTSFSLDYCTSVDAKPGDQIRVKVTVQFSLVTTYLIGRASIPLSNFTIMGITNAKEH